MKRKRKCSLFFVSALFAVLANTVLGVDLDVRGELGGVFYGTSADKIVLIDRIVTTGDKVKLSFIAENLLNDEVDEVRSRAAFAIKEIGDSTYAEYLRKATRDSYWQVRLYGIKGLIRHGSVHDIPMFFNLLSDSYWQVRSYAAEGLAKFGDVSIMPRIFPYLEDQNRDVQKSVLWSITRLMWRDDARAFFRSLSVEQLEPVLEMLKSPEEAIRMRTVRLLSYTGDARMAAYLAGMLGDRSDEIKIAALWAIEGLRSADAGREIEALLLDEDVRVKIEAVRVLVTLEAEEAIPGLVRNLTAEDEELRLYSLWALEKFSNPASYRAIVDSLADESPEVSRYASRVIADIGDPLFIDGLEEFFMDRGNPMDVRLKALGLMGEIGGRDVMPFMMRQMRSNDPVVRRASMVAAYNVDKLDMDFLSAVVYLEGHDTSLAVRREASSILGRVMNIVGSMLGDSDSSVRESALARFGILSGANQSHQLLLRVAYSQYPEVREAVLVAVAEQEKELFAGSVRDVLGEADIEMRKLAAIALASMGDRDAIPLLRDGLKHMDLEFQLICAWALARLGDSSGFSHAVSYIESDNVEHRKKSAEIMALLRDRSTSSILLRSIENDVPEVRVVSAWALARLGEEKGVEVLVRLSQQGDEPLRTTANAYLQDTAIPLNLRRKVPDILQDFYFERLGIREAERKIIYASRVEGIVPGDSVLLWEEAEENGSFIYVEGDNVLPEFNTRVAVMYDDINLYLLFICEDPDVSAVKLDTGELITVAVNPLNSRQEWYQFVFHPLQHIKYSYIWKLYTDDDPESVWSAEWSVNTVFEQDLWKAEVVIPLSYLDVDYIKESQAFGINFQRESDRMPLTAWTGRIDNPEQFGIVIFKE